MSADPPADDPSPAVQPAAPPAGVDLARAALAQARATARSRHPGAEPLGAGQSSPRSGSSDPQPVGAAIEALVTERGWQLPAAGAGMIDRWAELVGPEIAAHTEPVAFSDGVLVVQADSTAWATQLRLLAPQILRRVNTDLGHNTLRRLDVRGPVGPSWRHGRLRAAGGRGPRDTYG